MFCTSCGQAIKESARFCRACGAPTALLRREPEIRFFPRAQTISPSACPVCGSPLTPDSRFCSRCGRPLETGEPAACQYCGAPLEKASHFCESCGGRIVTLK